MQKLKRRTYIIDLNGPAARGNLKVLALLYPLWGLVLPIYTATICNRSLAQSNAYSVGFQPLLLVLYVGLVYFTLSILTNRIVITGKSMRFVHNLLANHKTSQLKNLALDFSNLTDKRTLIRFTFGESERSEIIDTEGMEDRMKARLMAAVDNLAPQCQMPRDVRTLLGQTTKIENIQRNGDIITIPYHSRLFLLQASERVSLYQQFFWRVWAAFFAVISVFVGPMLIFFAVSQLWDLVFHSSFISRSTGGMFQAWTSWWNWLGPVYDQTLKLGNAVATSSQDLSTAKELCVLAGGAAVFLGVYMTRPNNLIISATGLTLSLNYFGMEMKKDFLPWNWIAAIELDKAGRSTPENWKIIFKGQDLSVKMQLILGSIRVGGQRLELIKAIEKYASQIPVDAEVLGALAPPSESSYTELWLSSLASAPQREKLTPLSAGHCLKQGEYTIDARHGAGGQGVTYLAYRTADNQNPKADKTDQPSEVSAASAVAGASRADKNSAKNSAKEADKEAEHAGAADLVIKETILPVYVDSKNRREAVEGFERDARLLSKLEHAHLVQLRDYFIEDHRAYLVLDRVRGQNLRQLVESQGPLPPATVLALARQMCEILTYLHSRDPEIIHRDFTPENLMLGPDDQLKLIDFGVAHELKSRTTATVVGKHAYLPPEQFRGKPCSQSDLYAMGATLYFLLTGSDPEPLSRLNPQKDREYKNNRESENGRELENDRQPENDWEAENEFESVWHSEQFSDEEENILAILSKAIEHSTELDISQRTASAADVLEELTGGAVIVIKTTSASGMEDLPGRRLKIENPQPQKIELTNG